VAASLPPAPNTSITVADLDKQRLIAGPVCGLTPNEAAKLLRVSANRVRSWIKTGELGAIDTAQTRCGRPRYVILPHHLAEFERRRQAAPPPRPAKRRKKITSVDYYP
jgi:excisionase family DNA binding protein